MLLSEMFGVKQDVDFEVTGYIGRFILRARPDGTERLWWRLKDDKVYVNADLNVVYDIIFKAPANIIHLPPPLTDEQREQLKAIWTLGGRWIGKGDLRYGVYAFTERPVKSAYTWCSGGSSYNVLLSNSVCDLVSWSDPEPYDIGKALGVEK